jgi:sporulation protein YlmC with PRC-barrel domain
MHVHEALATQRSSTMVETTSITSGTLIAADKVKGTNVYNLAGDKLGNVDDIMIDKVSGRAIYAVMSFGGFLGMGENYYPLPWATLKYDAQKGGYVVNLDKKLLEGAPYYDRNSDFEWTPDYGRKVDSYYKAPSYWM